MAWERPGMCESALCQPKFKCSRMSLSFLSLLHYYTHNSHYFFFLLFLSFSNHPLLSLRWPAETWIRVWEGRDVGIIHRGVGILTLVVLVELSAICQSASTNEYRSSGRVAESRIWRSDCRVMHCRLQSTVRRPHCFRTKRRGDLYWLIVAANRQNEQKVVETISCHEKQVADTLMRTVRARVLACLCARAYVCMYVCMCVFVYVCMYACMHARMQAWCIYSACARACFYVFYVCACICTYMCVLCMCVCK
jgi:hypothetical protein